MKKFASSLLFIFIVFFAVLIGANFLKSLGLTENLENMENSDGILKQETKDVKTYNF